MNCVMTSIRTVVLSDASLTNALNMKGKLALVMSMTNDDHRKSLDNSRSSRYHCVSCTVIIGEIYALVYAFDSGNPFREALAVNLNG